MDPQRFDVVIAGAGLVGLALAPALARSGLSVALVDRAPIAAPDPDPSTWDARVYAISPGSAAFLRAIGAWQRLPSERDLAAMVGVSRNVIREATKLLQERGLVTVQSGSGVRNEYWAIPGTSSSERSQVTPSSRLDNTRRSNRPSLSASRPSAPSAASTVS
mgnify:CR=1 FL=1